MAGEERTFIACSWMTPLVTIVSLYELTGAMGLALNSDADWRPFRSKTTSSSRDPSFCFSMGRYNGSDRSCASSTNR
jgi:general L-amino acid transport system permease protein